MPTQENNFKDTVIGAIPDEWEVASVAKMYLFTKKPRDLKFNEYDSIPFVPMDLVPIGKLSFGDFILKKPSEFSSGTYFEAGDLLLAKITPSFENGKQGIIPELPHGFGVATTEVIPIKEIPQVSNIHFLAYFLLRDDIRSSLAGKMEGSTGRQRLSQTVVENLEIPLPPLPEQRTIVAILSKIQQAIEVQEKIIERTKELKKCMMAKLFTEGLHGEELKQTEIGMVPKSWEVVRLGEIADFKNGINFNSEQKGKGILTLDVLNMYSDDMYPQMDRLYRVDVKPSDGYLLQKDDILFVRSSLKQEGVGWSTVFQGYSEPATFCGFIIRAKLNQANVLPEFVISFLRLPQIRKLLVSKSDKVAITNINQGNLRLVAVPVPSMEEQAEIAGVLASVDAKIKLTKHRTELLKALFKSMLHQLITGTIRVNNIELSAP